MDLLNHLPAIASFLTFAAAGLSLLANSRKASSDVVTDLAKKVKALQEENEKLKTTDVTLQRDLNSKSLELAKLHYDSRTQGVKLAEYYQIITDKDPQTKETLALLAQGMSQVLEKLEGAEVSETV